jgi:RNA polymerase sigma-70 factor (ECF subfamily)
MPATQARLYMMYEAAGAPGAHRPVGSAGELETRSSRRPSFVLAIAGLRSPDPESAASEPERSLSREKSHFAISLSHRPRFLGHCYDTTRRRNVRVDEQEWLAERFDEHRSHLRAVAYRMLGSLSEADDAVQEAWLRVSRSGTSGVENLGGWLTTVVGRVALNMLRSRKARREEPLGVHLPDPILDRADGISPEHEVLLADSVGLALLVVLETLSPPERLSFVLHDMFGVPFDQIAPVIGRSPEAARQLASRARRRVQGESRVPDADLTMQRKVADAFLTAARDGDFEALLEVLDPDVVLRADFGVEGESRLVRGARLVAGQALFYSRLGLEFRPALVNGVVGGVAMRDGEPFSVAAVTVRGGKIVAMDFLNDPERLRRLDLTILE